MSEHTYFIARELSPLMDAAFPNDEDLGQYTLSDQERGELFSRKGDLKDFDPNTGEHVKRSNVIVVNVAPEDETPRLVACDPARKVIRKIVERGRTAQRQAAEEKRRKGMLLKAGGRIRSEYNVDVDAREAELDAPKFNPETDTLSEFLADRIMDGVEWYTDENGESQIRATTNDEFCLALCR